MFWKKFVNWLFDWNADGELDTVEQGARMVYENAKILTAEEEVVAVEVSEEGIALARELAESSPDILFTDDLTEFADELDFYYSGYGDIEDIAKILSEAGYDIFDLEFMDEEERYELFVSLDLDPEDFSF